MQLQYTSNQYEVELWASSPYGSAAERQVQLSGVYSGC